MVGGLLGAKRHEKRGGVLGAVLMATTAIAGIAASPAVAQTASAQRSFDIPAQSLPLALMIFGRQAGLQVTAEGAVTSGKTSAAVNGDFAPAEALSRLLTGTGLTFRFVGSGGVMIEPAPQSADGAIQLGPVRVEGDGGSNSGGYYTSVPAHSPVTEGTGSYTTRQMASSTGLALSPRETPQSVSIITRQRLDDQGAQTLNDALRSAPGITWLQLDSERNTFSSRGFSISDFQYDGISSYYKSNYAAGESELDLAIYDRIEIVRGATGLQTGAGEPSATVNLVRKRADSDTLKGEVSLSAGSWENFRGTADLALPITGDGRVRARLVGAYENKNSFIDRYHREKGVIYGVVDADLTSTTTLSVGGSYEKIKARGLTYGGVPLWYSDGTLTHFDRSFSVAPKWNSEDTDIKSVFANLEQDLGNGWKAEARFMHRRSEVDNARLFVWGYPDPETGLITDTPSRARFPGYRRQNSYDARVSGSFALAGRTHEVVFGFSHFDNKYAFNRIGTSTAWVSPFSIYDYGSLPEPEWNYDAPVLSERNHTKQSAAYGALRFSLADPLKLIVGGRYTWVQRNGAGWASSGEYDYSKEKFIPYAGVVWDFTDNLSLYASYTSIFNHQDYRNRDGGWLKPVSGNAYEAGLKGEFLDGRLNGSVAVFRIKQDNLGQEDSGYLVPGSTSPAYYETDGAVSKGIEAELSGEVTPGWNVSLNAAHFSLKDAAGANVNTYAPRTTLRLFTTYRLPGALEKLTVGGGINWQSDIYYDIASGPLGVPVRQEQKAYALVDLMARYDISSAMSFQVNLNNLFDKKYQTAVNWYSQSQWGAPRNILASLRVKF